MFDSLKPCYVTLTFETKILRGLICPGDPHQRNPNAPKFEDRSQEETEWQERCARETAWRLAKHIFTLKEKHKTTFFSLSENWCLPAPSTLEPEEREFVVDSGASMHMISKKDLNAAELETVTTMKVLEDTPAVLSPGKLCDEHGYPPAIVSSESVDRQVRGDPYSSEISEELEHRAGTERPVLFRHTGMVARIQRES